jgi:hypothetical protein
VSFLGKIWVLCNERVPFLGKIFGLKIALFYKKGNFGRKKDTFGQKGGAHPLDPPMKCGLHFTVHFSM